MSVDARSSGPVDDRTVRTAIFPSAGCATLWQAVDSGAMERHGVTVEITEVRSSDHQLQLWDSREVDVVHTAADHFLKGRDRRGVAVRGESLGVLGVYVRKEMTDQLGEVRWAVDHPSSAFALLLRAALAERGAEPPAERLVAVGGTRQRLASIRACAADGGVLHPPFDIQAEAIGLARLAAHPDVEPDLTPAAVFVDAENPPHAVGRYLAALAEAEEELMRGGSAAVAAVLTRHGWPDDVADAAARAVLATRPDHSREGLLRGVEAAARLRTRAGLPVGVRPVDLLAPIT